MKGLTETDQCIPVLLVYAGKQLNRVRQMYARIDSAGKEQSFYLAYVFSNNTLDTV